MIRFVFVSLPLLILFLIAVFFGALNKQLVSIDLFVGNYSLPVAAIAAGFLLLGFVIGLLSMAGRQVLLRSENRKLRKQVIKTSQN